VPAAFRSLDAALAFAILASLGQQRRSIGTDSPSNPWKSRLYREKKMPPEITCRRVAVDTILPLRHRILRPGLPSETARFDGDLDADTQHYAALVGEEPVACLSLMPSAWEGQPAWQLRGMTTDTPQQGRGLGRQLWNAAVAEARRDEPDRLIWCNARTSAVGFYEKLGWRVVSEPFDVPSVGPHVRMVWQAVAEPHTPASGRLSDNPRDVGWGSATAFMLVELAFLAAAHLLGGPPWVAIGVLAMIGQVAADFRLRPLVGLLPAAGWLVAHPLTGNRELFFPYALALAAHLAGQFIDRGRPAAAAAGGVVAAAFLAIRVVQAATAGVLAVEAAVAAAILALVVAALPAAVTRPWGRVAVTAVASLLAYAGLAL
jgi:predicted GNAT family N-acyltransferase